MVHCEIGTESTWEAFVLQCNKNKENINNLSSDIKQQPVSHRRDIKPPNDDSRDDSPTRRESLQQYSSINITKSKSINMGSSGNKQKASPTSVRTKLDGGGSKKKKSSRCQSAEWLDLSTDYSSSSSHTNNNSSDNSIDNDIDPNELVNQLNQIYIDQLLDVSEEKQNESLNLSIEIDDNNILYLSPPSPTQCNDKNNTSANDEKNNTTSLLEITKDITLTPSTSFLQLDITHNDKEMNVLEFSEITLGSSFLNELDGSEKNSNSVMAVADTAAVDMSISSRLDVSCDIMNSGGIEIVMNTHQMAQNTTEVADESIETESTDEPVLDKHQHTLNNSTITCDEFITEAIQTSFIENVKLGYNVVTNKLEKEFIDMGFADYIAG